MVRSAQPRARGSAGPEPAGEPVSARSVCHGTAEPDRRRIGRAPGRRGGSAGLLGTDDRGDEVAAGSTQRPGLMRRLLGVHALAWGRTAPGGSPRVAAPNPSHDVASARSRRSTRIRRPPMCRVAPTQRSSSGNGRPIVVETFHDPASILRCTGVGRLRGRPRDWGESAGRRARPRRARQQWATVCVGISDSGIASNSPSNGPALRGPVSLPSASPSRIRPRRRVPAPHRRGGQRTVHHNASQPEGGDRTAQPAPVRSSSPATAALLHDRRGAGSVRTIGSGNAGHECDGSAGRGGRQPREAAAGDAVPDEGPAAPASRASSPRPRRSDVPRVAHRLEPAQGRRHGRARPPTSRRGSSPATAVHEAHPTLPPRSSAGVPGA